MYKSDIEIAQECKPRHIREIAQTAGVPEEYLEQYGNYKAKVDYKLLKDRAGEKNGKLIICLKNLTVANNKKVLEKLDSFVSDHGMEKSQFIIETRDHKALELLTQNDYYTSYYVDFDEIDEDTIRHLEDVAQTEYVKAFSFPSTQYWDIRDNISDEDIDFLTWAHRDTQIEFLLKELLINATLIQTIGHLIV